MSQAWLRDLKLAQLHRLATLVGSPCSGTKPVRIHSIQQAVESAVALTKSHQLQNAELSIVSIDMGIRNLAYCNLKTPFPRSASLGLDSIKLEAWQRVAVAEALVPEESATPSVRSKSMPKSPSITKVEKETFEPQVYAKYAYDFVKKIVDDHRPSHILIERQRFRSGGGSAVQEWTIRVGMFESMLYAALRTLAEQKYCKCEVSATLPPVVNRFWLSGAMDDKAAQTAKQKQSDRVKKQKIQIAGNLLSTGVVDEVPMSLSGAAMKTKEDFLAKLNRQKSPGAAGLSKLDDLADSLLQGLAWISWQRNRLHLRSIAEEEFDVERLAA